MARAQANTLRQAAAHIQQGRWNSAIELLENRLAESPGDVRTLNLLGIALSSSGRAQEASQYFEKALAINPKFHPALKNLAVNEMSLGQTGEALAHFRELLKYSPRDPVAHLALGEAAYAEGDFPNAVEYLEKAGAAGGEAPPVLLKLAHAYKETGQHQRAKSALARLPNGADAQADFQAGLLLAEMGAFEAAVGRFQSARPGFPDPYQAGFNLALAQLKARQPMAAAATIEDLAAKGHRTAELYNLLSRAYEAGGDIKKAYEALRMAIELEPSDGTNYIDLIALCLAHRNFELGLEIADIAVARLARNADLHLQRGVVLAMKGDFESARKSFDTAAGLAPQNRLPHVAMGLVLLQMDRIPEAIEALREQRDQVPTSPLVHWFLAEALHRYGARPDSDEEREALQSLNKAIELQPDLVQAHILLGKILQRRGELEQAAQHLEKAIEIEPEHVSATYQLARVRQMQGHTESARELFAKVREAKTEDRNEFAERGLMQIVRKGAQ